MSNHVTAKDTRYVKLIYTNDVVTYIDSSMWSPRYVKTRIEKAIERGKELLSQKQDEDDNLGMVWAIDFTCNYDLNTSQLYLTPPEFLVEEIIEIGYPYDLGEDESWEDVIYTLPDGSFKKGE